MEDKYQQYFDQAKAKMRQTGAGGIELPNPDLTARPQDPIKVDPKRQVILKGDWVVVGGKTVKTTSKPKSPIQILGMSAKIIDGIRDATKKDKKGDESA